MSATGGSRNIDEIESGDRVISQSDEAPHEEALGSVCLPPGVPTARRLGRDEVLAYDPYSGDWFVRSRSELVVDGESWIWDGQLFQNGVAQGPASPEDFRDADASYELDGPHGVPCPGSWVLLVGADGEVSHARLEQVLLGERFAYQGRLIERVPGGQLRISGEVLGRVLGTTSREAPTILALTVRFADGSEGVIEGTPEHPFYVPAEGKYVSLRRLVPGMALQTERGEQAVVLDVTRVGDPGEVFNFEVEGVRNYFAGSAVAGQALVHNGNGCYVIQYPNGCMYVGKGDQTRSKRSERRNRSRGGGQGMIHLVAAASTAGSYALESMLMDLGGWDPNRKNKRTRERGSPCHAGWLLNKINSPGHRF